MKDFLWQVLAQVVGFYVVAYVHITIWKIAYQRGLKARDASVVPEPPPSLPGVNP